MKNASSGYNKNTKSNDGPKHNVYPGPDESIKHNMGIGHMENSGHNANLDYVIIGNSAAGVAAAESIRKIDKKGKISIFTDEKYLNYSKPLITYFLSGKLDLQKVYFKDSGFY